ncbi:MAG: DUF4342 domain-containing protein [Thermoplasmata archaeon]
MKCERCEMDSPDSANYCMHCGARLNWPEADIFFVNAEELLRKLMDVIEEGKTRHVIVKDQDDNLILDIPLNTGITAVAISPWLASAGIFTALTKKYKITLIRK